MEKYTRKETRLLKQYFEGHLYCPTEGKSRISVKTSIEIIEVL